MTKRRALRKPVRTRGKFQLSRYFQELNVGDKVSIIEEKSLTKNFSSNLQGRTGNIIATRGNAYIVEIREGKTSKQHIINPIHLKKIKA